MRQTFQRGWIIRLIASIVCLLVPSRRRRIRKPLTGIRFRVVTPAAEHDAEHGMARSSSRLEGNWWTIDVAAFPPAVVISTKYESLKSEVRNVAIGRHRPSPAMVFPVECRCPEPQALDVATEPDRPAIEKVSDLDFAPPQLDLIPVSAVPAEIVEIPTEPLGIPLIIGRVRRSGSSSEEKASQPLRPTSGKLGDLAPKPIIPPALWEQIWKILSPPPRIEEIVSEKYPGRLRPYQVDGVRQLIEKERFILADEMGTGKTVQVCVALSLLVRLGRIRRILIVCPKTVITVWTTHLRDWAPEIVVHSFDDFYSPRVAVNDTRAHAWVTSYPRMGMQADAVIYWGTKWDVVVLDEVHEIRNSNTKKYRNLQIITSRARYRWGLSGTPLQNRLEELTNIFQIVVPELKLRAETLQLNQVREKIRPWMRRVTRKAALPDLPPKERVEIWLKLDPEQVREYEFFAGNAARQMPIGAAQMFTHIWQVLMHLKRICNFASNSHSSPKTQKLVELVEQITRRGEKVVVFTQFRHYGVDRIAPHLRRFGLAVIHGGCSDAERSWAVQQFQNNPQCRALLGTVQTMGFGLTLTAANHVIHFDHWWNPAVAWQAEDRVYRIGQTRPVTVYEFWMKGTVEERVRQILEEKGLLHQEVIERLSEAEFKRLFTLDELLALLHLRPSSLDAHGAASRSQQTGTTTL
ncbi:MAG TPA: DEAD/DEAH box helicase [Thermogutta sp.]|nr:DEAD/DEAH box helicase [Thermogutta sp.]